LVKNRRKKIIDKTVNYSLSILRTGRLDTLRLDQDRGNIRIIKDLWRNHERSIAGYA